MRVGLDASPLLHGERAVRRNSRNLLKALTSIETVDWRALYFDRKGHTPGRLGLEDEVNCRWPMRMLMPAWKHLSWPSLESIAGQDMDIFYAPDLCFPPAENTKVLTTVRGVAYMMIPELCVPKHVDHLMKAFSYARHHADYFLAVSESTKVDMLHCTDIPAEQIYVSSHGVDPQFYPIEKSKARAYIAAQYEVQRPYFLFVGVIAAHKNVRLLIDAMLSASQMQEVDLILAGPWQQPFTNDLLSYIASQGLSERVHLIGEVSQNSDALTYLYSGAVAFLFPTFYEGWCAPPLESMACGTAVLSTQIPSVQEVTGTAAVLLPVDEAEAWGVEMQHLAEDELWRESLEQKGLQHIVQHSWANSAQRLLSVMKEIGQRHD
ncbi:MAG: glycosyltransferase family 1 protein [Mariprofundaceae bacterium]